MIACQHLIVKYEFIEGRLETLGLGRTGEGFPGLPCIGTFVGGDPKAVVIWRSFFCGRFGTFFSFGE